MRNPLPAPRICLWFAIAAAALLLAACGGGGASSGSSGTVTSLGAVVDDQGIPLAGADIKVIAASAGATSASTANDGSFSVVLASNTPGVIRVEKAGYMPMVRAAVSAASNASFAARVVLLPVASTQTFDSTQAAVLRVPGSSARVELAAGSLVRTDGQAISGSATVQLTPIDPSKDISYMPGVMVDAASGTPIESLGALSVTFTDATGAPLNLASGQTATIRIPATPAAGATGPLPATFPLYHLNETTGLWEQEGTATLRTDPATGDKYYEGTVSHFSWWNADQPLTRSTVDIGTTLSGANCTVPPGSYVVAQGMDYNGSTGANGNNVFVRQNSQVRLFLVDRDGFAMDSVDLTSATAGSTVRMPRCLADLPRVIVSGRVTVTSGSVNIYRVQISGDLIRTVTAPIAADGSYSVSVRASRGIVRARLVSSVNRGTPDTEVTTTVAAVNASFPDLTVQDTTVNLNGCVQGWSGYRQSTAQVSLFKGATVVGEPQALSSSTPNFSWTVPINTTYTVRLTTPDATLAERSASAVVGNVPLTLGSCISLPVPPQAAATVSGTAFDRNFSASTSVAGDAAITSYAWTFGDGTSGTGVSRSHTYASTGSYTVNLVLTDSLGQKSTTTTFAVAITSGGGSVATGQQIVGGAASGCAINATAGVECWAGDAPDTKTLVAGLSSGVTAISNGGHYCAITSTGGLKCWGDNTYGQLGNGTTTFSETPVDVTGLSSGVVAVSAGGSHTCAIASSGALQCWGLNSYGKLGNGGTTNSSVPVSVSGLTSGVVAVSANRNHTCAATNGAGVFCWGFNNYGQLGNGTTTDSVVPVAVANLTETVAALSAGDEHTCALTSSGGVKCWGNNTYGQLGDNTTTNRTSPVDAIGLKTGVISISGTDSHICALTSDGSTWCWGYNTHRQVQDSDSNPQKTPVRNTTQTGVAIGVTTDRYSTCILRSNRTIQCWGWLEAYAPGG